jgi:integrase
MADLFRPTIIEYTLGGKHRTPDGRRVTKDTPGATRTEKQSKKWYGRVPGRPNPVPLSEKKEVARRMLDKLRGDAALGSVGLADPCAEHRQTPLETHLQDYLRDVAARGPTEAHVTKEEALIRTVLDGCEFTRTQDLDGGGVADFLAGLRKASPLPPVDPDKEWYTAAEAAAVLGILPDSLRHRLRMAGVPGPAPRRQRGKPRELHRDSVLTLARARCRGLGVSTSNDYLAAVKRFGRWLFEQGRTAADSLARLKALNAEEDPRHQRRALPEEIFARFVEATAAGKPFRGITGPDRLVIYTLAANTGFRARELASLTPVSFELDGPTPTVTVEAACSKHRRTDVQPLRADVAEMMRQYLQGRPRRQALWPGTWKKDGAAMVRIDLAAAGIEYADERDRCFDFHALRGQFITMLAKGGVHPKVAQVLARHSTITLTMDYYTRLEVRDVAGALDKLPALPGAQGAPCAAAEEVEPACRPSVLEEGRRRVS